MWNLRNKLNVVWKILEELKEVFADKKIKKIGFSLMNDMRSLNRNFKVYIMNNSIDI